MSVQRAYAPLEARAARRPVRISAPGELPITVETAKAHLRLDHAEDDALIGQYIQAAAARLDAPSGLLGQCLIAQRWRQDFVGWGRLRLPFGPAREDGLVEIAYVGSTGELDTLELDGLEIVTDARGPFVDVDPGMALAERDDAVRVSYEAGVLPDALPGDLQHAVLLLASHFYDNREISAPAALAELPFGVDEIVDRYRVWSFQ